MSLNRREFLKLSSVSAALCLGTPFVWHATAQPAAPPPEVHYLNRLTWGIRPQDLEQIRSMGISAYLDRQLAPESIEDPLVDAFVGARRFLTMTPQELQAVADDQYDVVYETALWARLYRAAFSERQLYERMVEFWTDHFNIPIPDLLARKIIDDRDVIRRYAMARFRDLLFASAQSPAMLEYLDNAVSSKDHPNENYARELLELHTLGVDGGYTEQDVYAVARAFTGWTVRSDGTFFFDMSNHDTDPKTVLGVNLPAGRGIEDGLQVLDIVANHPATARFISTKLIRRFVQDDPPAALVESTAAVFTQSAGDIRAVLRHLLTSGEFLASAGQKFRRPLDFVIAALRALSPAVQIDAPYNLIDALEGMGQVPYSWHPPDGYPERAEAWINTNGLLERWNFALNMSAAGEGYFPGLALNAEMLVPQVETVGALVDAAVERVLHSPLHPADRDTLIAYVSRQNDANQRVTDDLRREKLPGLLGLLIASPYFQWY